jgi:hypothetical protein
MANAFFCRSDVSIKGENESVAKPIKNISKYFDRLLPVCAQHEHGHTLLEALIKIAKLQI